MTNPYYNHDDGVPAPLSRGLSLSIRAELDKIQAGFDAIAALGVGAENTTTLTDGDTITWDFVRDVGTGQGGQMAFLTFSTQRLTRVLANPLHLSKGKFTLIVTNHPSGGQNFSGFGNAFVIVDDTTPNLAANAVTMYHCNCDGVKVYIAKHGGATAGAPAPTPAPTPAPPPPPAGPAVSPAYASGLNLAGMEEPATESHSNVRFSTGTYPNRNYSVPRAATLAYLASVGITKVRLPLDWELLQPIRASSVANATVVAAYTTSLGTHTKGALWEPYAQYIDKVLDAAQAAGIKVILDIHNYARYWDFIYQADGSVIGFQVPSDHLTPPYTSDNTQVAQLIFAKVNPTLPQADFNDLWTRMATRWKAHAALGGYDLMNEPNNMPAVGKNFGINNYPPGYTGTVDFTEDFSIWATYAQAAITAIRAVDGTTPIYVEGNGYSSCINWTTLNPSYPLTGNNLVYEFHMYPDASSSGARFDWDDEVARGFSAGEGGIPIHTTTGRVRMAGVVSWAAAHGSPPLALGEHGMVIEGKPDGTEIDQRWIDAADDTAQYCKANNIELYPWQGGDYYTIHAFPINVVPKLHQGRTVPPIATAIMLKAQNTNQAVIFDDGGNYSTGGAAITRKVQARGFLTGSVSFTLSSDNGGTFSPSTTVTLAAGLDSTATYTFTPPANNKATVSYARTGGGQAPPSWVAYSYTDPVTLASTNLTDGGLTILAKYSAACWLAKDSLKEYLTPVAASVAGDALRGISSSGFGGTVENPNGAICWLNQDAGSLRGTEVPALYGKDSANNLPVVDMTAYGRRGLLNRKAKPSSNPAETYLYPTVKMPFKLKESHFMMACFVPTSLSVDGVIVAVQSMVGAQHSALKMVSSGLRADLVDLNGLAHAGNASSLGVIVANAVHTAALVNVGSSNQRTIRLNGGSLTVATSTDATLAATEFDTYSLGFGYWNFAPQDGILAQYYGWIIGAGAPTDPEMVVLENYLRSFSVPAAGGGPTDPGEIAINTEFTTGANAGFWGDNRNLQQYYTDGTGTTNPATWGDLIGRWINHGNTGNGHDLVQTTAGSRPQLGTDGGGKHYFNSNNGQPLLSVGGSTTAFFAAIMVDDLQYAGVLMSDMDVANHGFRIRYDGNTGLFYFAVGRGASTLEISVAMPWAGTLFQAPGKHLVEAWYDGTNIGLRIDKSGTLVTTSALGGTVTAGQANLILCADAAGANVANGNYYEVVIEKNHCPTPTERGNIVTWVAAQGGLTI